MIELLIAALVCGTVIGALMLVLAHLKTIQTGRDAFLKKVLAAAEEQTAARLKVAPDFYKDLEKVNANQIALAKEIDLIKKTTSIATSLGRARNG